MVFFCFSSKDRHMIVESIFYHITNYGVPVWYDRKKMLMGDQRDHMNFDEGVGKSNYAVIVLSQNAMSSVCACEEIELIHEKHGKGEMYVFPIFYELKATDIPDAFSWMTKLVYKELDASTDSLSACNHILCKYLLDELSNYRIQSMDDFFRFCQDQPAYTYIREIAQAYGAVNDQNHDAKIALLYAGCQYLRSFYPHKDTPKYYFLGVDRLFTETKLHLPIDLREMLIMERLFLLLFNASIFGCVRQDGFNENR